jgi:hypothetical protein
LARVALARSEEDAALAQIEQVLEIFAEYPWAGLDDPFELYLTCYRVLDAHRDPRASQVLCTAQERLQASAEQIDDLGRCAAPSWRLWRHITPCNRLCLAHDQELAKVSLDVYRMG